MKIAFGMIVFNSDFVLKEVLESIYPYAEQVLIAEGPVKYWADRGYTTSTDMTNKILESFPDPDNKIKIVRGPYPEKDDMCNKYIEHMNDDIDYVWHVDADEVYKSEDIEKIIELLEENKYTSVGFRCYSFYGGMDRYITGYEENYEFMRLFKVYPGTTWSTHRPPTVKHLEDVQKLPDIHLSFEVLDKEHGIRIYHYSYVFPRQVYEKISYYKAAVSKENCRDNYFEEIYMPWVLGDEEAKNIIEKNNDGVHEFISRDSTFTKKLERNHPKVIENNLEQLESIYHSQLKHYFYKINGETEKIKGDTKKMSQLKHKINNYISILKEVLVDNFDAENKKTKQKIISSLCSDVRDFATFLHAMKKEVDWSIPPSPEWFDHYCDQYFSFSENRNSHWVERGVYSSLVLCPQTNLLELCHGDGYNSYHFYSNRCKNIYAIDFDQEAHDHAVEHHSLPNITFKLGDIRKDIPNQKFDAVIWDTAIEHFTEEEISSIMGILKKVMTKEAVLTGHTLKEEDDGSYHLHQHEREFKSKEDLAQFFEPYFKNVFVFETVHVDRHNYYFYASDSILPLDSESEMCLRRYGKI